MTHDKRHTIWHETGHWLHMQKYRKNPRLYEYMQYVKLNQYQKDIVKNTIGEYAAEDSVNECIAETFSRLMSGESYNQLHPEVFQIYTQYNGPMPKIKYSTHYTH